AVQRTAREVIEKRKPNLQKVEFTWLISAFGLPNLDVEPLKDVRVRRALHMAVNAKDVIQVNPFGYGHGAPNPLVPSALRDWSIPIDQLPPEGRRLYQYDPAEAKRLLTQAGVSNLKLAAESTNSWGPVFSDVVQAILAQWKKAGIETDLKLKEGNAFIASVIGGTLESLARTQVREAGDDAARGADDPRSVPRQSHVGKAVEPGGCQRRHAERPDHPAAADVRREEAPGDRLRDPAAFLGPSLPPLREPVSE